jgi:hypothetical protein
MILKDSGVRKEFESGAVRDIADGKGRMDLLDLECLSRLLDDNPLVSDILSFVETKDVVFLETAMKRFIDEHYEGCIPTGMIEVSKQFEDGAKKYSPNNWTKGINLHCYIDSALRHYMKFLRGDTDEPHDRAVLWNLMCGRWTYLNKPELDDVEAKGDGNENKEKTGI